MAYCANSRRKEELMANCANSRTYSLLSQQQNLQFTVPTAEPTAYVPIGGEGNLRPEDSWLAGREPLRVGGRALISLLPVVGRLPAGVLPDRDASLRMAKTTTIIAG